MDKGVQTSFHVLKCTGPTGENCVKPFEEYVYVTKCFKKTFKYRHMFAMISAIRPRHKSGSFLSEWPRKNWTSCVPAKPKVWLQTWMKATQCLLAGIYIVCLRLHFSAKMNHFAIQFTILPCHNNSADSLCYITL